VKSLLLVSCHRPRSSCVRHHDILTSSSKGCKSSLFFLAFLPLWSVKHRILSKIGRIGCPGSTLMRKRVPTKRTCCASCSFFSSQDPMTSLWYSTAPKLGALEDGLRDHLRVGPDPVAPLSVRQQWLSQIWFQLGEAKKLQVSAAEPAMSGYFKLSRRRRAADGEPPTASSWAHPPSSLLSGGAGRKRTEPS